MFLIVLLFIFKITSAYKQLTINTGYNLNSLYNKESEPISLALDIGCGCGSSTQQLADRFPNSLTVGLDKNIRLVEIATKMYPHLMFIHGYAEDSLFSHNIFDHVQIQFSMLHLTNKFKVMSEIKNILKPGGNLYIIDYDRSHSYIHEIESSNIVSKYLYNDDYKSIVSNFFTHVSSISINNIEYSHYRKSMIYGTTKIFS